MMTQTKWKCIHKGWSGTRYYMEVTEADEEARRKAGLVLGVIIGMPVMAVIFMIAGGVL